MKKTICFRYKNNKIHLVAEECGFLKRFTGLMFATRKNARALLFDFGKPNRMKIHSLFVFFPFFAVWLDEKNNVIDMKKIKPFALSACPKKPASKLVEIPINKRYNSAVKYLHRRQ